MKAYILYRPSSGHARTVEEFHHEFEKRTGRTFELLSLDTREGAEKARLYDIVSYPAVLVVRDDGQLMKDWQGEQLPMKDEVLGYLDR